MYLTTDNTYKNNRDLLHGLYNGDKLRFYGCKTSYTLTQIRDEFKAECIRILNPENGRKLTIKFSVQYNEDRAE